MGVLKEHLKFDKGNVGYLKVMTDKFLHRDYWSQVDEIVEDYARVHPVEMEIVARSNIQKQEQAFTKWGEGKGNSEIRLGLSMPVMLLRSLETFDPEIFTNHNKKIKFGQRFKGLCTYAGK
jgi:hypothetical protein